MLEEGLLAKHLRNNWAATFNGTPFASGVGKGEGGSRFDVSRFVDSNYNNGLTLTS